MAETPQPLGERFKAHAISIAGRKDGADITPEDPSGWEFIEEGGLMLIRRSVRDDVLTVSISPEDGSTDVGLDGSDEVYIMIIPETNGHLGLRKPVRTRQKDKRLYGYFDAIYEGDSGGLERMQLRLEGHMGRQQINLDSADFTRPPGLPFIHGNTFECETDDLERGRRAFLGLRWREDDTSFAVAELTTRRFLRSTSHPHQGISRLCEFPWKIENPEQAFDLVRNAIRKCMGKTGEKESVQ